MAQANFAYDAANDAAHDAAHDAAGMPLTVSIYADLGHVREQVRSDAAAAGLRIGEVGPVAALLEGGPHALGEVVVLDCPAAGGATLAALARLDIRAANTGAQLIVSTSVAALDDVFGCLDQSLPQILVEPTRGERVIALGRALAKVPDMRVRELSRDDRLTLLRLTEQVGQIAERLERLSRSEADEPRAFRFESPAPAYSGEGDEGENGAERRLVRKPKPPLPDPRLVREVIRQRQLRAKFFDGELFADPAWDILLDLTAARAEHTRVSVTSLCIASGVPPTTALRWIGQMTEAGLLERIEDEADRRRAFIALSDRAAEAMARYFAELGKDARLAV
jgi:hypothetical protein